MYYTVFESCKNIKMLKVKQFYYDIKHTFSCIFKFIGTECDVTQPITDGKIECKTDAELSAPKYSGNIFLIPRIQQFDINDSVIYYVNLNFKVCF